MNPCAGHSSKWPGVLRTRIGLTVLAACFGPLLSAQEICDNGIDDDGNGLVDLNDTLGCPCSLQANVSFEISVSTLEVAHAASVATASHGSMRAASANPPRCEGERRLGGPAIIGPRIACAAVGPASRVSTR